MVVVLGFTRAGRPAAGVRSLQADRLTERLGVVAVGEGIPGRAEFATNCGMGLVTRPQEHSSVSGVPRSFALTWPIDLDTEWAPQLSRE